MKLLAARGLVAALFLSLSAPLPALAQTAPAQNAASARDTAAEARIRADVTFLADDALEGRGTGQRGYDLAALYVRTQMEAAGLKPGAGGEWLQTFTVARLGVAEEGAALAWTPTTGAPLTLRHGEDALFNFGREAGRTELAAELVFAGYGLVDEALGLDDYAGLDVTGRVVVILSGVPAGLDAAAAQRLEAGKTRAAEARGAVGVLTVNTDASAPRYTDAVLRRFSSRTETTWIGPDGQGRRPASALRVTAFLNDAAAAALFAGAPRSYADIRAEAAAEGGRPAGFALSGRAAFEVNTRREDMAVANVIGLIEGADPVLKHEYVVMTAHLDHLGMTENGDDHIFNGALDNAGGVASMLEAARTLAVSPPRRSILVVALAAEEVGLIGSDYLARHPVVEGVVANVNLDMPILTYAFTDVVAFGAEHSSLGPLTAAAAQTEGVVLSPDPMPEQNIFVRSDHYSFVQAGIPAVMLATGYANGGEAAWGAFFANGYHKPNDEVTAGFDWEAAARFARINAAIARAIADADQKPLWYEGNPYGDRFAPGQPRAPAPAN